jgi:hypothetical protein
MATLSYRIGCLLLTLFTVATYGCGGGTSGTASGSGSTPAATVDTSKVQTGAVVQGPISGATVFADNVAAGTRFVLDSGEIAAAPTGTAGSFSLPSFPSYDFVLVSTGGTDTITGLPALLLLAQAGSANITPLTTLVTLDTTKTLRTKLESMMGGTSYDTNVSVNSSPAILLLIKSAETAVQSVSDAVKQAGVDAGKPVPQAQLNYIQAQTWQQIALEFARTTQNFATPAGLDAALTAAITNAITAITAEPANSNISISSVTSALSAATLAHKAVDAALSALGAGVTRTSTVALSTTTVRTESSLVSPATVFDAAVKSTVTALKTLNSVVVVGIAPNPYSPAPIPVVTTTSAAIIRIITGAAGGSGAGIGITF